MTTPPLDMPRPPLSHLKAKRKEAEWRRDRYSMDKIAARMSECRRQIRSVRRMLNTVRRKRARLRVAYVQGDHVDVGRYADLGRELLDLLDRKRRLERRLRHWDGIGCEPTSLRHRDREEWERRRRIWHEDVKRIEKWILRRE